MKNMLVRVEGQLPAGVTAKDIVLAVIGKIGTAGGNGHAMEFAGSAIRELSMEGRMTICNMSIEAGARVGLVAVDDTTVAYVEGRPYAPKGEQWKQAVEARKARFPTLTRCSTPWSSSTLRKSSRRSAGAPRRRWSSPSTSACRTRLPSLT